jgi:hypothetical protein
MKSMSFNIYKNNTRTLTDPDHFKIGEKTNTKDGYFLPLITPLQIHTTRYYEKADGVFKIPVPLLSTLKQNILDQLTTQWSKYFRRQVSEEDIVEYVAIDTDYLDISKHFTDYKNGMYRVVVAINGVNMDSEAITLETSLVIVKPKVVEEIVDTSSSESEEDNNSASVSDTVNEILEEYTGLQSLLI